MRRFLWGIAFVMLLTGCGIQEGKSDLPSVEPPSTPVVTSSSPSAVPEPPFSPAIPTPPPDVACEVTKASAETEYGQLVSGDNAELDATVISWSSEVLSEIDIKLTADDPDVPSVHLVLHVRVEGYVVQQADLVWSNGETETLFVDYLSMPTDRIEGDQDVVIVFGGDEERLMELTVVC